MDLPPELEVVGLLLLGLLLVLVQQDGAMVAALLAWCGIAVCCMVQVWWGGM